MHFTVSASGATIACMPSWNIHIAHVEHLLATEDASVLGISDVNSFLYGNLLPDVYVGYLVHDISKEIKYVVTHVSKVEPIPVPSYDTFWDRYVTAGDGGRACSDLTLGCWAHLVCDATYNAATREWLANHGMEPGEEARIAKQSDFASFGKTLGISLVPKATDELRRQCEEFPQYEIVWQDVLASLEVARRTVEESHANELGNELHFELFTEEFFERTTRVCHERLLEGLLGRKR